MGIEELFQMLKKQRAEIEPSGPVEWIVAGLGNPGRQYEGTRHNAGFLTLDRYCEKHGIPMKKLKFKSLMGEAVISGKRCILLKPSTYMNNSGEAIRECANFYKIPPGRIVILVDDISLSPGTIRVRRKGSDGGQNGLKSIIYHLNSNQFPRVKIGIGERPHKDYDLADWVLSGFSAEEMKLMQTAFDDAADAMEYIVAGNIEEAMQRHN